MKASLLALAAVAAFALTAGQTANAAFNFNFNQAGTGAPGTLISGFNESAGNALAKGGDTAIAAGVGSTFQLYFQTTLGNLIDPNGNPIGISPGQLTAVGNITEVVTGISGTTAQFAVAAVQAPGSGLALYANPTVVANASVGSGFITGTPILTASAIPSVQGTLNSFTVTPVAPGTEPLLDQSPGAPGGSFYPTTKTVNGSGVSTVDFKVLTTDPGFFPVGGPALISLHLGNAGANVPFTAVHPAFAFQGGTVFTNVGTVNGLNGPDFLFQTSGTITANPVPVPEPSSLALMGLGLAGVFAVARRKRAAQVA